MKKLLKYLSVLSVSCVLYGSEDTDYYISEENDSASIKKTCMGTITPPVNPNVKHGINAFMFGDFIYWSTRLDNLVYTQRGIASTLDKEEIIAKNKTKETTLIPPESTYSSSMNHKMSPGFKAGVGVNHCHDGWDSLIRYTWLHSSASESSSDVSFGYLNDFAVSKFLVFNTETTSIKKSSSMWTLRFNAADWELGRTFYISQKLILRPCIGLKGSWQHQYYSILLSDLEDQTYNLDDLTVKTFSKGSYNIYNQISYWGVGIRPGLSSSWLLTQHFSIFSESYVSAMWSYFQSSRKDNASQTTTDSNYFNFNNLTITDAKQTFHTITPVLELQIGLRWETMCSNDDYRIRFQAGWEEQLWFNQNQFININGYNPYGNLSFQGVTAEIRIDF